LMLSLEGLIPFVMRVTFPCAVQLIVTVACYLLQNYKMCNYKMCMEHTQVQNEQAVNKILTIKEVAPPSCKIRGGGGFSMTHLRHTILQI
jgi:hypothetical protein